MASPLLKKQKRKRRRNFPIVREFLNKYFVKKTNTSLENLPNAFEQCLILIKTVILVFNLSKSAHFQNLPRALENPGPAVLKLIHPSLTIFKEIRGISFSP